VNAAQQRSSVGPLLLVLALLAIVGFLAWLVGVAMR
jgi:hypothetical protein